MTRTTKIACGSALLVIGIGLAVRLVLHYNGVAPIADLQTRPFVKALLMTPTLFLVAGGVMLAGALFGKNPPSSGGSKPS